MNNIDRIDEKKLVKPTKKSELDATQIEYRANEWRMTGVRCQMMSLRVAS